MPAEIEINVHLNPLPDVIFVNLIPAPEAPTLKFPTKLPALL